MVAKSEPVRRSRRAASLTAQYLWNMQIEEDNKGVKNKPGRKHSTSKEPEDNKDVPSKRGRKRSTTQSLMQDKTLEQSQYKKQKLSGGCSGHIFPVTKPLQVGRGSKTQGKLTASVAPLVNSQPIRPKTIRTTSTNTSGTSVSQMKPILLLPVSLQANDIPPRDVGSLPVLTLQASHDLFNCLGFNNKAISNTSLPRHPWNSTSLNAPSRHNVNLGFNTKNTDLATLARQQVQAYSNTTRNVRTSGLSATQDEPLNLKMGETTVPSSSKGTSSHGRGKAVPNLHSKACSHATSHYAHKADLKLSLNERKTQAFKNKVTVSVKPNAARSKPHRKNNRSSPVTVTGSKRSEGKCPSPDYACSSPDVDDVHREARHSCNRPHINLRNKAAPPPSSREYAQFIEEQRRLLAEANRRKKLKAKRAKVARKDSEEDRPLTAPEPFKVQSPNPEASNNGWRWAGKPYSALVFSVDGGKHVKRVCYPSMTRKDAGGMSTVMVKDCVFLLAGGEDELPYVAKVTALWEKPKTKEMMMSLVWYYRPEHTDDSRQHNGRVSEDELFASRHQDEISVACVEERCNVLTYAQYCRVQARLRRDRAWRDYDPRRIVPRLPHAAKRAKIRRAVPGEVAMDPEDMFFSRKMYDVKNRRVLKYLPPPTSLSPEHGKRTAAASVSA